MYIMTELLIIKTANAEKIRSLLAKSQADYQIVYNETIQDQELTAKELEKQIAKDYQEWANDPEEWKDARGE